MLKKTTVVNTKSFFKKVDLSNFKSDEDELYVN